MKEDLNLGTFFWKCFYGHVECNSDTILWEKNCQKAKQFSRSVKKRWKEPILFSKENFFLKMIFSTPGMQFWQPRQKKSNGRPIMFASGKNILKHRYFAQKNYSINAILWTRIRKFWQPRWREFVKRPKLSVH